MIIFGVVLMIGAAIVWLISLFRAPLFGDIGAGVAWLVGWMMLGIVFVIGLASAVIGVIARLASKI
jgi:hypothetical protein